MLRPACLELCSCFEQNRFGCRLRPTGQQQVAGFGTAALPDWLVDPSGVESWALKDEDTFCLSGSLLVTFSANARRKRPPVIVVILH